MPLRYSFPYIYAGLVLPLFNVPAWALFIVAFFYLTVSLSLKSPLWIVLMQFALSSLITFIFFLVIVQSAVCVSVTPKGDFEGISICILKNIEYTVSVATCLVSVMVLAISNEWRSSLVDTINGLAISRRLRVISIIAAAMIGEFRKTLWRVHHAFTARGDASPRLNIRNLLVLPSMLGCIWAAVLNTAAERMKEQWSSEVFWTMYVPVHDVGVQRDQRKDLIVIVVVVVVVATTIAWRMVYSDV